MEINKDSVSLNPIIFSQEAIEKLKEIRIIIEEEKMYNLFEFLKKILDYYKFDYNSNDYFEEVTRICKEKEVPKAIVDIINYLMVLCTGKESGYLGASDKVQNNIRGRINETLIEEQAINMIQGLIVSIINLHSNILEVFCATLKGVNRSLKEQLEKNS